MTSQTSNGWEDCFGFISVCVCVRVSHTDPQNFWTEKKWNLACQFRALRRRITQIFFEIFYI
jgi:hypothetical protein